jgi:histone-lysine N-methyltransferase SETMAR
MSRFRAGEEGITDKERSGRPCTSGDEQHVIAVTTLLEEDARLTCDEIAHELGISHGTVFSILTDKLGKRRVVARWVPHQLSDGEKLNRLQIARSLRSRYRREGNSFINRIVAIDETWVRSYEPELKSQSSEWHRSSSPRPVKFRREQSKLKQMMIFAYDAEGILVSDHVPVGQRINKNYYQHFLRDKLRPAIRKNRPSLLDQGVIILHDNASVHKAGDVIDLLEEYGWEILPHPAYSPDMSPPDYDLFHILKKPLRGKRFHDLEELSAAVTQEIKHINKEHLATGIKDLVHRWDSVIIHQGDYIERA